MSLLIYSVFASLKNLLSQYQYIENSHFFKKVLNQQAHIYDNKLPVETNPKMFAPTYDQFELGQESIFENINCPEEFFSWAFADIQRDLVHIFFRGIYPWIKDKGVSISCCTD